MQTLDIGEAFVYTSDWYDEDGAPAEPSAITLDIHLPDGTTTSFTKAQMTTPDIAPAVLDTWERATTITATGLHRYTFTGTVDGRTVIASGMFVAGDAAVTPGPCGPWAQWSDVLNLCPQSDADAVADLPPARAEYLGDVATWVLYNLDGRHYPGICTRHRRVCRTCVGCGVGLWCTCGIRDTIDLTGPGGFPVWGVWDVTIDGEVLPATAYRVRDYRWLDRIDGEMWPCGSDLSDPDAFHYWVAWGRNPPIGLVNAAAVFWMELALRCVDSDACRLPERVTSIVREGVTYTIIDPQKFLDVGRTGIADVDLALTAAKAGRTQVAPGGFSPLHSGA